MKSQSLKQYSVWMTISLLATGCAQKLAFDGVPLVTKTSDSVTSAPQSCVPGATVTYKPTKFLFIVDTSGSNVDGPDADPAFATDPAKNFRFGVINNFFIQNEAKPNMQWGFETFSGNAAHAYINSGDDQHGIFSNAAAMSSALTAFLSSTDSGQTPYHMALKMAHDMIQMDMVGNPMIYQYRIAFLTDGYPTDYCLSDASGCTDAQLGADINVDIQSLISLAPGSIQMSTVYYGQPDSVASARLQTMAAEGDGQFVDTNVTKNMSLDDVISVPTVCPPQ